MEMIKISNPICQYNGLFFNFIEVGILAEYLFGIFCGKSIKILIPYRFDYQQVAMLNTVNNA